MVISWKVAFKKITLTTELMYTKKRSATQWWSHKYKNLFQFASINPIISSILPQKIFQPIVRLEGGIKTRCKTDYHFFCHFTQAWQKWSIFKRWKLFKRLENIKDVCLTALLKVPVIKTCIESVFPTTYIQI